jgi:ribonuclease P/MRP protein subunit POP5
LKSASPTTAADDDYEDDDLLSAPAAPELNEAALVSIVRESLAVNFGQVGWAEASGSLQGEHMKLFLGSYISITNNELFLFSVKKVKYLSPHTQLAIIRTSRTSHQLVWAALTFIRQIKGVDCSVRMVHVGGTIRKTQQAAVKFDRELILARSSTLAGQLASSSFSRLPWRFTG